MDKITLDFAGLTREQISEIQSLVDTKLVAFRRENERMRQYLSVRDPNDAFEVYMKNAKPTTSRVEVWNAAVEWCKEQAKVEAAQALADKEI